MIYLCFAHTTSPQFVFSFVHRLYFEATLVTIIIYFVLNPSSITAVSYIITTEALAFLATGIYFSLDVDMLIPRINIYVLIFLLTRTSVSHGQRLVRYICLTTARHGLIMVLTHLAGLDQSPTSIGVIKNPD